VPGCKLAASNIPSFQATYLEVGQELAKNIIGFLHDYNIPSGKKVSFMFPPIRKFDRSLSHSLFCALASNRTEGSARYDQEGSAPQYVREIMETTLEEAALWHQEEAVEALLLEKFRAELTRFPGNKRLGFKSLGAAGAFEQPQSEENQVKFNVHGRNDSIGVWFAAVYANQILQAIALPPDSPRLRTELDLRSASYYERDLRWFSLSAVWSRGSWQIIHLPKVRLRPGSMNPS